jgi:predicted nuclease of predicted toxin-antitoxin system
VRILFDHCVPAPLRRSLAAHEVKLTSEMGWQGLMNGDLLVQAEAAGFNLLISTDQNIRYQQTVTGRSIAILVLLKQNWPELQPHVAAVSRAVNEVRPGSYHEISFG